EYQSFHLFIIPSFQEFSMPHYPNSIKRFKSENDFKGYIAKSSGNLMYNRSFEDLEVTGMTDSATKAAPSQIERSADTNVQVAGIDEPDVVKTGNGNIYVSTENRYRIFFDRMKILPPVQEEADTKIVKAFPVEEMAQSGTIKKNGNLFLDDDTLAVFADDGIYGYNTASSSGYSEKWKIDFKDSALVGARKYDEKIYVITKQYLNYEKPCPLEPLAVKGEPVAIACNQIYHPIAPTQVSTTYTAFIINFADGKIEKNISFVGSEQGTALYMSPLNIYLGYDVPADWLDVSMDFLKNSEGILPESVIAKLEKLEGYELSHNAKSTEFEAILGQYNRSLSEEARKKFEADMSAAFNSYLDTNKRDLEKTNIVKISLSDFRIEKTGAIPGRLLNQFSLDEYDGNLRAVTTIGQFGWWGFGQIQNQSANDLYVLNKDLGVIGSIKNFGLDERVYSVRFINDKGYVVTFKQTDPFFVMDLSDPQNPQIKGELKIPGFSSYLHQLSGNEVLGIGREESKVKISLFNVSVPEKPEEVSKYSLDEYWSGVFDNYHAFFLDKKHKIFFIPGDNDVYIFSYDGGKINLIKKVDGLKPLRATYINDYFYLVGEDKIVVLDEEDWEEVKQLEMN
ncbi:MAG: beta-propeller domain-containing protein, partial [Patescibacteria group bacterium]